MTHYIVPADAIEDAQGRTPPRPAHPDAPRTWWAGGWIVSTPLTDLTDPEWLAAAPGLAEQPVEVLVQVVLEGVGSDARHVDELHHLIDLSAAGLPGADRTGPFRAVVRLGDLLVEWDAETADGFARERRRWMREHGVARVIENTDVRARHPWPDDAKVQGGGNGLVITRDPDRPTYRTAFVEVFVAEPRTFIRGEGATVPEAEDAAWAQLEAIRSCPTSHSTFETRGYRNGLGFCTGCGMSRSGAFDVREVGHPCSVCGVGCFYSQRGEEWFCEEHAPARDEDDLFGDD